MKHDKKTQIELLELKRQLDIRQCRKSFWHFCKVLHSYKNEWKHLKDLCNDLQLFFENKLLKPDGSIYEKLMINMPPRHYKTRTLILFSAWVFGQDAHNKIISTSYSDDLATEFSRYTRDEIKIERNDPFDIVYSDIFPDTKIKHGDASLKKWALEGQHFSYLGAGFGAAITGKGADIGIIDDQVKSFEEATNDIMLEKRWNWYIGTFISRLEEGAKQIICMTRWAEKDICGMLLNNKDEKDQWFQILFEAYDKDTDKMLCDDMLSKDSYLEKKRMIQPEVFEANYHQRTVDKKGKLYQRFTEYDKLPMSGDRVLYDRYIAYVDTADEGADYLCVICGIEYNRDLYVTDIYYTQKPQEITEPKTAEVLIKNKISVAMIESNNGGRAFARNVDRMIKEKKSYGIHVQWFHQGQNKNSRIITIASNIESRVFYPKGWNYKWPAYYDAMATYKRGKKNKHDDAPDATTGIVEFIDNKIVSSMPKFRASDLGL